MALGCAQLSIKRRTTYLKNLQLIIDVLDQYIETANNTGKNGWQAQAIEFSQELKRLKQTNSLYLLRDKTTEFCDSLRSTYNYWSSSVFGDSVVQSLSSYVGVGAGSTLREKLMTIVQSIDPLDASYISEEIFLLFTYQSRTPFELSKLSADARRALTEIALDSIKELTFYEASRKYNWNIAPETLIRLVKEQDISETKRSIKHSTSRGYFYS